MGPHEGLTASLTSLPQYAAGNVDRWRDIGSHRGHCYDELRKSVSAGRRESLLNDLRDEARQLGADVGW